jgi:predicted alpha/beta-fold hydrolase
VFTNHQPPATNHRTPGAFTPTPWLRHRHAQTLWAALVPTGCPALVREPLALPDGDVVDLHLTGDPAGRPAVLVMHGLEGSLASPYARHLLKAIAGRGWCGVFLHARGSAGVPNRLKRGYHAAHYEDAAEAVGWLRTRGARSVSAVGVSLGANQLLVWLGTGSACPLERAVAISPPFDLAACAATLERGFTKVYGNHLLACMRRSLLAKSHLNGLTRGDLARWRTVRAIDDGLTAPLHGFAGVDDYYTRASCGGHLAGITTPTLILHAADDPLVPAATIPAACPPAVTLRCSPRGGHVGSLTGWWPRQWLPSETVRFLAG